MWQDWVNGILGLVVLVIAFMGLIGSSLVWTFAVLGVIIAIVGFWWASAKKA